MRIVTFRAIAVLYGLVNCIFSIHFFMTLVTKITGFFDRREFVFTLTYVTAGTVAYCRRAMNKFILAYATVALIRNTRVPGGICNPALV